MIELPLWRLGFRLRDQTAPLMAGSTRVALPPLSAARVALDDRKWLYSVCCSGLSLQHTTDTTWSHPTRASKLSASPSELSASPSEL
jgi:hypothetical protein